MKAPLIAALIAACVGCQQEAQTDSSDPANWKLSVRELTNGKAFSFDGRVKPPAPWGDQADADQVNRVLTFAKLEPVDGTAVDQESITKSRLDRNVWVWTYPDGKAVEVRRELTTLANGQAYDAIGEIRVVSHD